MQLTNNRTTAAVALLHASLVTTFQDLRQRPVGLLLGVSAAIFSSIGFSFALSTQLPLQALLATKPTAHAPNEPIKVELNQAVDPVLSPKITPAVKGEWKYEKGLFGASKLSFVPAKEGLATGTTYTVKLENAKRTTGQPLPVLILSFTTETAPKVAAITPAADSESVAADAAVSVTLASENNNMRQLSIQLIPAAETDSTTGKDDKTFSWQPRNLLAQGQTYTLKVFDARSRNPAQPVAEHVFSTSPEPLVAKTTSGFIYPDRPIEVTFNKPMDKTQPGIKCACVGEGTWTNDVSFQFTPKGLRVATTYAYTVPAGVRSQEGGVKVGDTKFEARTPGHVRAAVSGLGSSAKTNAAVTISFDQPVNRASAQAHFSISPAAQGSFRWVNDSVMVFSPAGYESQTTYQVGINAGVEPVRFGLASNSNFSMRFTTEPKTIKLSVPVYRQQHRSSCEAAALRMALAFRGINQSDRAIVEKMGYNPRSKDKASNSWDDPNDMYVGNIDGAQSAYEAYGAYAPAIAKAARAYGREAAAYYGVGAGFIGEQIAAGNPVVIIGTIGRPSYVSWNGPNGIVHAWMGEHARTVVGVVGNPSNPVGFWVNDPIGGSHGYWTVGRLLGDINAIRQLPSQVVVVR